VIRETQGRNGNWGRSTTVASVRANVIQTTDSPGRGTYRYIVKAFNAGGSSAGAPSSPCRSDAQAVAPPTGSRRGHSCRGARADRADRAAVAQQVGGRWNIRYWLSISLPGSLWLNGTCQPKSAAARLGRSWARADRPGQTGPEDQRSQSR
jgi:hypothetical protein